MTASLALGPTPDVPLSRVNPVAQLTAIAVVTVVLLTSLDVVTPSVVVLAELCLLPAAGLTNPRTLWLRTWPLLIGAGTVGVVNLLLGESGAVYALGLALRVVGLALPGVFLVASTDPVRLADALTVHWRFPARFAVGALAALRLVPLLVAEFESVRLARRTRGVEAGRNPVARVRLVAGIGYIAHARRRSDPILDLSLLRYTSFRLSLIGGSLTRVTQGAQPFLLPMMLQLGFGMTAAASGAITVAGAIGSLAMKGLAPRILRRFGFRRSLIVGGLCGSLGYALCGAFRPDWPIPAIFAVLMSAGFFMSFQFSAYNTIAYDEVPKTRMSAATSFYATFQQLMLSLGICVGAAALHMGMLGTGRTRPELADFTLAFLVVTAVSAAATIWNMRFAADAGAAMSGHRARAT